MGRGWGINWEHAIDTLIFILFFLGMAIIFADLWLPIIPLLQHGIDVVVDPILFMLILTLILSILWNLSFYLRRRKELKVARKLIRWVASQRSVMPRTDKEIDRVDRVLRTAIWSMRNGEDVQGIIKELNEATNCGNALPEGWARFHYETAINRLMDAAGRDHVLAGEARERDLQEGEKMLWATRAENMRSLVYEPSSQLER